MHSVLVPEWVSTIYILNSMILGVNEPPQVSSSFWWMVWCRGPEGNAAKRFQHHKVVPRP